MVSSISKSHIVAVPKLGCAITDVVFDAAMMAKEHKMDVHFKFNDIDLVADTESYLRIGALVDHWDQLCRGRGRIDDANQPKEFS